MIKTPSTWITAPLGQISARITKGTTPTTNGFAFQKSGVKFIKIESLVDGRISLEAISDFISEAAHEAQGRSALKSGDVLFSIAGTIGETAIVQERHLPANTNQALAIISGFQAAVTSEFLEYQLKSFAARETIGRARGGAMNNISLADLRDLTVAVAPTKEQHSIVAKIEELFSELDKGVESLTTAREQLKVYRQAVLDCVASGQLLADRHLRPSKFGPEYLTPLSSVVSELDQGWSPKCHNHSSVDIDTWAVMKTTAIQHLAFDGAANKELPRTLQPRTGLEISAGDILVTRAGPRTRVGVACLVRYCRPKVMLCDKAYRIRCNVSKILPEYLELLLNAPHVLRQIERIKTGISDSGVNLTQDGFMKLEIMAPPIAEQKQTLGLCESMLSIANKVDLEIDIAISQVQSLRQSILQKAFSGQLVPQDPNDEPASVLLERIKAEKERSADNKQKPKKLKAQGAAV